MYDSPCTIRISQPVQNTRGSQGLLPRIAISKRSFERKERKKNVLMNYYYSHFTRAKDWKNIAYIIFTFSQLTRACVFSRSLLCSIFIQWINLFVNVNLLKEFSPSSLRRRCRSIRKANVFNNDCFNNGCANYLPNTAALKRSRRNFGDRIGANNDTRARSISTCWEKIHDICSINLPFRSEPPTPRPAVIRSCPKLPGKVICSISRWSDRKIDLANLLSFYD